MTYDEAITQYPILQELSYGDLIYMLDDREEDDIVLKAAVRIVLTHRREAAV